MTTGRINQVAALVEHVELSGENTTWTNPAAQRAEEFLGKYSLCNSEFTVFPLIGCTDPSCFDALLTLLSALDQRYGTNRYTKRWEKTLSQPSPRRHRLKPGVPAGKAFEPACCQRVLLRVLSKQQSWRVVIP